MGRILRSAVTPILVVAAIVGFLLYVDSGRGIPFLQESDGQAQVRQDGGFYSLDSQGIELGASDDPPPEEGQLAPDFALQDLNGAVVRLSDFKGKTVVLNFWATWCAPCRREFPEFVSAYEENREGGLVIVAVNLRENVDSVRKFADDFGAAFPILLDADGSVASLYRIRGLPVTWFIDREGFVRSQVIGMVTPALLERGLAVAGFVLQTPE